MDKKNLLIIVVFSLLGGLIGGSAINIIFISYFDQQLMAQIDLALKNAPIQTSVIKIPATDSITVSPKSNDDAAAKKEPASAQVAPKTSSDKQPEPVLNSPLDEPPKPPKVSLESTF